VDLRAAVKIGVDQADRQEVTPLNQETIDAVKRRGREREAARKPRPES